SIGDGEVLEDSEGVPDRLVARDRQARPAGEERIEGRGQTGDRSRARKARRVVRPAEDRGSFLGVRVAHDVRHEMGEAEADASSNVVDGEGRKVEARARGVHAGGDRVVAVDEGPVEIEDDAAEQGSGAEVFGPGDRAYERRVPFQI